MKILVPHSSFKGRSHFGIPGASIEIMEAGSMMK